MIVPLSQRDERWKDVKLGFSTTTIGSHGCVITCIAMLAGLTPDDVNERLKKVSGFAEKNLVIWEKIENAIPWLKFIKRARVYNNDEVKNNLPCIVEVDGTRIGAKQHFVLYIGNQEMADPWFGNIKSTNYYAPIGYAVIQRGEKPVENMAVPDYFKTLLLESSLSLEREGEFREFWGKALDYDEKVKTLQNQIITTNEALSERAGEVSVLTEENQKLRDERDIAREDFNKERDKFNKADWEKTQAEIKVGLLEEEVKKLQEKILNFKEKNNLYAYSFWERLFSLFKRDKTPKN